MSVVVLVLEDRPERFSGGVVVACSGSSHRANDLQAFAALLDLAVTELTATVSVKFGAHHEAATRAHGLVQRLEHDPGVRIWSWTV